MDKAEEKEEKEVEVKGEENMLRPSASQGKAGLRVRIAYRS